MTPSSPPHLILLYPEEFTDQEIDWAKKQVSLDPDEQATLNTVLKVRDVFDESLKFEESLFNDSLSQELSGSFSELSDSLGRLL